MICPKYSDDRNIMFNQIIDILPNFESYDEKEKFEFLMKCNHHKLFFLLTKMLQEIVILRGSL